MDQDRRQHLQRQWVKLIDTITDYDGIVDGLYAAQVLTKSMKERIGEKKGTNKLREILDILPKRGNKAFEIFYDVLVKCSEYDAANLVCPERADELKSRIVYKANQEAAVTSAILEDELPAKWPDTDAHDPFKIEVVRVPEQDLSMRKNFHKAAKGLGSVYPMSKPIRGLCLVISNQYFKQAVANGENLEDRDGTDVDRQALQTVFENLGFEVHDEHRDLTAEDMLKAVENAARQDHTNYDCFVCAVMTHGKRDEVYGVDGKLVHLDKLKNAVDGNNSPTLVGKPKLFFIQACQGVAKDGGVGIEGSMGDPLPASIPSYSELGIKERQKVAENIVGKGRTDSTTADIVSEGRVSSKSDIFVALATVPDFVSWRNTNWGTWFIQAVVYIFSKLSYKYQLTDLMTYVNKLVSRAETRKGFKQVSVYASSLTSQLYFFPGLKIGISQPTSMVESHSEVDIAQNNQVEKTIKDASSVQEATSLLQTASLQHGPQVPVHEKDSLIYSAGPVAQPTDDVDGTQSVIIW